MSKCSVEYKVTTSSNCQLFGNILHLFPSLKQPHSIVQRRLLEGNITRLRGEARDPSARVRSPLADSKDGQADAEERSESTADDSTEERESPEESERSLRSDEEDDSSEAAARSTAQKTQGTESSAPFTALVVQCKVPTSPSVHWQLSHLLHKNRIKEEEKRARLCSRWLIPLTGSLSEAGSVHLLAGAEQQTLAMTKAGPHTGKTPLRQLHREASPSFTTSSDTNNPVPAWAHHQTLTTLVPSRFQNY